MKKFILPVFALSVFAVGAASIQKPENIYATTVQESKISVKLEELPEAVKTTLKADAYREWIPSSAYLVKTTETEHYAIDMKKGIENITLKISNNGEEVE